MWVNASSDGAEIKVTCPRAQGKRGVLSARHTGFLLSACSKPWYSVISTDLESVVLAPNAFPPHSTDVNLKTSNDF